MGYRDAAVVVNYLDLIRAVYRSSCRQQVQHIVAIRNEKCNDSGDTELKIVCVGNNRSQTDSLGGKRHTAPRE